MTTKLKVRPVNGTEPGSWRVQRRLISATRKIAEASAAQDQVAMVTALDDVYDLVVARLYVDDDATTVEQELNLISVVDFQPLMAQMTGESVPIPSSKP